jgi:hypothetical protein
VDLPTGHLEIKNWLWLPPSAIALFDVPFLIGIQYVVVMEWFLVANFQLPTSNGNGLLSVVCCLLFISWYLVPGMCYMLYGVVGYYILWGYGMLWDARCPDARARDVGHGRVRSEHGTLDMVYGHGDWRPRLRAI